MSSYFEFAEVGFEPQGTPTYTPVISLNRVVAPAAEPRQPRKLFPVIPDVDTDSLIVAQGVDSLQTKVHLTSLVEHPQSRLSLSDNQEAVNLTPQCGEFAEKERIGLSSPNSTSPTPLFQPALQAFDGMGMVVDLDPQLHAVHLLVQINALITCESRVRNRIRADEQQQLSWLQLAFSPPPSRLPLHSKHMAVAAVPTNAAVVAPSPVQEIRNGVVVVRKRRSIKDTRDLNLCENAINCSTLPPVALAYLRNLPIASAMAHPVEPIALLEGSVSQKKRLQLVTDEDDTCTTGVTLLTSPAVPAPAPMSRSMFHRQLLTQTINSECNARYIIKKQERELREQLLLEAQNLPQPKSHSPSSTSTELEVEVEVEVNGTGCKRSECECEVMEGIAPKVPDSEPSDRVVALKSQIALLQEKLKEDSKVSPKGNPSSASSLVLTLSPESHSKAQALERQFEASVSCLYNDEQFEWDEEIWEPFHSQYKVLESEYHAELSHKFRTCYAEAIKDLYQSQHFYRSHLSNSELTARQQLRGKFWRSWTQAQESEHREYVYKEEAKGRLVIVEMQELLRDVALEQLVNSELQKFQMFQSKCEQLHYNYLQVRKSIEALQSQQRSSIWLDFISEWTEFTFLDSRKRKDRTKRQSLIAARHLPKLPLEEEEARKVILKKEAFHRDCLIKGRELGKQFKLARPSKPSRRFDVPFSSTTTSDDEVVPAAGFPSPSYSLEVIPSSPTGADLEHSQHLPTFGNVLPPTQPRRSSMSVHRGSSGEHGEFLGANQAMLITPSLPSTNPGTPLTPGTPATDRSNSTSNRGRSFMLLATDEVEVAAQERNIALALLGGGDWTPMSPSTPARAMEEFVEVAEEETDLILEKKWKSNLDIALRQQVWEQYEGKRKAIANDEELFRKLIWNSRKDQAPIEG